MNIYIDNVPKFKFTLFIYSKKKDVIFNFKISSTVISYDDNYMASKFLFENKIDL